MRAKTRLFASLIDHEPLDLDDKVIRETYGEDYVLGNWSEAHAAVVRYLSAISALKEAIVFTIAALDARGLCLEFADIAKLVQRIVEERPEFGLLPARQLQQIALETTPLGGISDYNTPDVQMYLKHVTLTDVAIEFEEEDCATDAGDVIVTLPGCPAFRAVSSLGAGIDELGDGNEHRVPSDTMPSGTYNANAIIDVNGLFLTVVSDVAIAADSNLVDVESISAEAALGWGGWFSKYHGTIKRVRRNVLSKAINEERESLEGCRKRRGELEAMLKSSDPAHRVVQHMHRNETDEERAENGRRIDQSSLARIAQLEATHAALSDPAAVLGAVLGSVEQPVTEEDTKQMLDEVINFHTREKRGNETKAAEDKDGKNNGDE